MFLSHLRDSRFDMMPDGKSVSVCVRVCVLFYDGGSSRDNRRGRETV